MLLRRSILLIVVNYLILCSLLLSFDVFLRFIRFNDNSVHNGKVQSHCNPIIQDTNPHAIPSSSSILVASAVPSAPSFASMRFHLVPDYLKNNDIFEDPKVNEQIHRSSLVSKTYKNDTERVVDKFFLMLAMHGVLSYFASGGLVQGMALK